MYKISKPDLKKCVENAERVTCNIFEDITSEDINSSSRIPKNAYARFVVWYILKHKYGFSSSKIARVYGKHYSSILYGIERAEYLNLIKDIPREYFDKGGVDNYVDNPVENTCK